MELHFSQGQLPCARWNAYCFVQVSTVDGPAELRVPAGSQPGDTLVIPKKGVPKLGKLTMRGDHFFKVNVTIPKKIR